MEVKSKIHINNLISKFLKMNSYELFKEDIKKAVHGFKKIPKNEIGKNHDPVIPPVPTLNSS